MTPYEKLEKRLTQLERKIVYLTELEDTIEALEGKIENVERDLMAKLTLLL